MDSYLDKGNKAMKTKQRRGAYGQHCQSGKTVMVSFAIQPEVETVANKAASDLGMTRSQLLRNALDAYLSQLFVSQEVGENQKAA